MKTAMASAIDGITEELQILPGLSAAADRQPAAVATKADGRRPGSIAQRFLRLSADLDREAQWEDQTQMVLWAVSWASLVLACL